MSEEIVAKERVETGLCSCPSCGPPTEVDNTDPCGCVLCGDCSRCDANGQPGQCCSEDCCDPVEGACANTVGIWGPISYTWGAIGLGVGVFAAVIPEVIESIPDSGVQTFTTIAATAISIGALASSPNAIIACARA